VAVSKVKENKDQLPKGSKDNNGKVGYYMKQTQVLDNACGIIACLHTVLNNLDKVEVTPDSVLGKFNSSASNISPAERATLLENDEEFRKIHQSYAGQGQSAVPTGQEGVTHHFIAFVVNKEKQLIELDGCIDGPNVVAENCDDVLRGTIAQIQKRLADGLYNENMSMMTLCSAQ
jgi:ubiquitin carboxyl-terminal hydrolase L3